MQADLISLIIPIYNAQSCIPRCMDCVQNQTYRNIEIIIIDDGSTDNSYPCCKFYEKRDSRIKIFRKTNGGPASARNEGICHAQGKYLYFMDVDDILEKEAIELLHDAFLKSHTDFIIGNTKRIDIYNNERAEWKTSDKLFEDRKSIVRLVYAFANDIKSYRMLWSAWGKLYRADIIQENHIWYNEKLYGWEDVLFVISYLAHCSSAYYIGDCLYTYRHYGQANIASSKSYMGPLDFRYTVKEAKKILCEKKYAPVIANCYSEYAIWSIFNNVRLVNIHSAHDFRYLYRNVYKIVHDHTLQKSIKYYVQKHSDNARIIPFFIQRKWTFFIIVILKLQIIKNNIKSKTLKM